MTSNSGWQKPEDSGVRPATARLVDPEEDLGSASYGQPGGRPYAPTVNHPPGEPETTRISPFGAPGAEPGGSPSTAYGLIGNPEPLPYVQPAGQSAGQTSSALPAFPPGLPPPAEFPPPQEIVAGEADVHAAGRRGTQDLGLLLLRLALGVVFIAHGLQKAFGWWGGEGLGGFKTALSEAGYQNAEVLTYVGAGAQIAAGVLLVLGLFTPLAAAGALAYLVNGVLAEASAQRRDGGLLVLGTQDGAPSMEYLLVLAVLAAVIILAGPGRYGFDASRGWARRPFIGSAVALILGLGGGIAAWYLLHGTNPFA